MYNVDLVEDASSKAYDWDSGNPLSAARGCILGVIFGIGLWTVGIWAYWSLLAF